MAFPHATPGYIPSPLQSPYFAAAAAANPLAHINPAIMFPTTVTSAVTEPQSVAMVNTTDSSRSVQMQAALLQQAVPGQFHAAAAQAAAQAQAAHHAGQPHHHPHLQLQHQHHHHHHQQKANKGDRAEVNFVFFYSLRNSHVFADISLKAPNPIWISEWREWQMGKLPPRVLNGNFCFPAEKFFVCYFCKLCFDWLSAIVVVGAKPIGIQHLFSTYVASAK